MEQCLDLAIRAHNVRPRFVGAVFLPADRRLAQAGPERVGVRATGKVEDLSQDGGVCGDLGHGWVPSSRVRGYMRRGYSVLAGNPLHPPFTWLMPGHDH